MILSNLLILFFISSIFHLKDLVTGSRYSSIAFSVTSLGAIFWWLGYSLNIDAIFQKATVYSVYQSIPLFIFLMLFEKFNEKVKPIRTIILVVSISYWCICILNSIAILAYKTNFIDENILLLSCYLLFIIHILFLLYNSDTFLLPQFTSIARTEILINFSAIGFLILVQQYTGTTLNLFPIIFSILYALVFLPYLIQYSIRTYQIYIQSFIFSILVLGVGFLYIPYMNVKSFNNQNYLLFLIMPFILILSLKLFYFVINKINSFYPFSIINKDELSKLTAELKITVSLTQIKKVIFNNKLFKSPKHKLFIWVFDHSQLFALTDDTPKLMNDLITFMQYREMINYKELDELIINYSNTPFQNNVLILMEFMKQHKIVQIMLIQKSNDIVGISAISCQNKRFEVLDFDTNQHKKLATIFANSIINLNSANQNVNYQIMMEQVNASISRFNLNHSLDEIIQLSRKTILNIIPETKYYLFLNFDQASGFYKSTNKLNFNIEKLNIKLHINIINDYLKDNISCKFLLNNTETPSELQAAMLLINANQAVLLRVDDSDDSSIIILFFKTTIDLLDYRIPFCQMFLRQFEVFCNYQSNYNHLLDLQTFLKRLLDQLPSGIMIVNSEQKIDYLNSKIKNQLDELECLKEGIHINQLTNYSNIIEAINYVKSNRSEFTEKIHITTNNHKSLYLLSGFAVFQGNELSTIIVLTNIQQSKELIDQMNQTNRLAMMSKIAKGVSYELVTPVQQLIDGVSQLKFDWMNKDFQEHFSTAVVPQVDRINLLCQSLLRLSRSNTESLVELFLPDLLDQVLRLIAGDLRFSEHKFYIVHIDREWVVIDQVMAIQVLMNLMIFSITSMAKKNSRLSLELRTDNVEKLFIKIGIKDYQNNTNVSEEELKEQLELSIVNQIVINQNGQFEVHSENTMIYFEVLIPIKHVSALASIEKLKFQK
jgi:nitrogen-specific signal transduction histidine kinase